MQPGSVPKYTLCDNLCPLDTGIFRKARSAKPNQVARFQLILALP
jgi:hypothetical protein